MSRPQVLFLVGAPGVGKTTLARLLLTDDYALLPSPKWSIGREVCAVGHYTGATFDGGDTVPFNGAAACLAWWEGGLADRRLTLLDGDRFTTGPSREWAERVGDARVLHLVAPQALLDERRARRGSNQNEAWAKGRLTKAGRFAAAFPEERRLVLEADRPPATLLAEVQAWLTRAP